MSGQVVEFLVSPLTDPDIDTIVAVFGELAPLAAVGVGLALRSVGDR